MQKSPASLLSFSGDILHFVMQKMPPLARRKRLIARRAPSFKNRSRNQSQQMIRLVVIRKRRNDGDDVGRKKKRSKICEKDRSILLVNPKGIFFSEGSPVISWSMKLNETAA